MAKPKEMVGKTFHRLTVLKELKERKGGSVCYECECVCGNNIEVKGKYLRNGDTKSCGCLNIERIKQQGYQNKKHGFSSLPEYNVYKTMISRCINKKHDRYYRYGGRGIKVCDRWLESFDNFYKDMGERPSKKHQIDRIDNNGNYEPGNCHWVLPYENAINKEFKPGKLGIRNIYKDKKSYYTVLRRQGKKRVSSYQSSIDKAVEIRDNWIQEYKEDKDKWIEDTTNNTYKK